MSASSLFKNDKFLNEISEQMSYEEVMKMIENAYKNSAPISSKAVGGPVGVPVDGVVGGQDDGFKKSQTKSKTKKAPGVLLVDDDAISEAFPHEKRSKSHVNLVVNENYHNSSREHINYNNGTGDVPKMDGKQVKRMVNLYASMNKLGLITTNNGKGPKFINSTTIIDFEMFISGSEEPHPWLTGKEHIIFNVGRKTGSRPAYSISRLDKYVTEELTQKIHAYFSK